MNQSNVLRNVKLVAFQVASLESAGRPQVGLPRVTWLRETKKSDGKIMDIFQLWVLSYVFSSFSEFQAWTSPEFHGLKLHWVQF